MIWAPPPVRAAPDMGHRPNEGLSPTNSLSVTAGRSPASHRTAEPVAGRPSHSQQCAGAWTITSGGVAAAEITRRAPPRICGPPDTAPPTNLSLVSHHLFK